MIKLHSKVERVEELVGGGSPDVSYMDNERRSPLHAAAFVGNSEIVEILISQVREAFVLVDHWHFWRKVYFHVFSSGRSKSEH